MSLFNAAKATLLRRLEVEQDLRGLLATIDEIDAFKRDLTDAANTLHSRAYRLMENKTAELEGIGVVERTTDVSRTWNSDAVLAELIAKAPLVVHPDSGELTIDGAALLENLRATAHIDYWKIKALVNIGLDPDKYCEKKWGNKRVRPQRRRGGVPTSS